MRSMHGRESGEGTGNAKRIPALDFSMPAQPLVCRVTPAQRTATGILKKSVWGLQWTCCVILDELMAVESERECWIDGCCVAVWGRVVEWSSEFVKLIQRVVKRLQRC